MQTEVQQRLVDRAKWIRKQLVTGLGEDFLALEDLETEGAYRSRQQVRTSQVSSDGIVFIVACHIHDGKTYRDVDIAIERAYASESERYEKLATGPVTRLTIDWDSGLYVPGIRLTSSAPIELIAAGLYGEETMHADFVQALTYVAEIPRQVGRIAREFPAERFISRLRFGDCMEVDKGRQRTSLKFRLPGTNSALYFNMATRKERRELYEATVSQVSEDLEKIATTWAEL